MKFTLTIEGDNQQDLNTIAAALAGVQTVNVVSDEPPLTDDEEHEPTPEAETPEAVEDATEDEALDSNGFPWDERIHASTRSKNKDGTWKYRRGISDEVKKEVETELKGDTPTPTPVVDTATAFAPTPVTFGTVALKLAEAKKAGDIDQDWVDQTMEGFGLPNFGGLAPADRAEDLQRFHQLLIEKVGG